MPSNPTLEELDNVDIVYGKVFLPGFEPGTFRVWGERDDHYTTETC